MRSILLIGLAVSSLAFPAPAWAQQEKPASRLIERGERLFQRTCARCHNAMEPDERTNRQWEMIVPQMREIANITREEARAIIAYLVAENEEEQTTGSGHVRDQARGQSIPAEVPRSGRSSTDRDVGACGAAFRPAPKGMQRTLIGRRGSSPQ